MDCETIRDRIADASAEPGALERLMAGDTVDAVEVAGHLAACPACLADLERVRRTTAVVREVLADAVDPGLRDRTLAFVRLAGRPAGSRGSGLAPTASVAPGGSSAAGEGLSSGAAAGGAGAGQGMSRRAVVGWVAGVAAAAVLAAGFTAAMLAPSRDAELARQSAELAVLSRVSTWSVRVEAAEDARHIALAGASSGVAGSLAYSPASGDLVVVATGLTVPGEGEEYGCWLESSGRYARIGAMRFAGDLAAWAGPVGGLGDLGEDARFEVSLDPASATAPAEPVLWGSPQAE